MLTVHHLGISQSDRIVWLCEELDIPYKLVRYERVGGMGGGPAEYKALYPFGTAPVITDGDLVLGESGAIIEYVMTKYGDRGLKIGPDQPGYTDYLYWFHFANGSLMPAGFIEIVVMLAGIEDNPRVAGVRTRIEKAYAVLEQRLGEAPYLAGDKFTAADIMTLFPLTTLRKFVPRDLSPYPNILRYLQRIGERPAFRTAMKKADPDLEPLLT